MDLLAIPRDRNGSFSPLVCMVGVAVVKPAEQGRPIPNKFIFPTSSPMRRLQRVGEWIAEDCDLLVAVWDGEKARGLGGQPTGSTRS